MDSFIVSETRREIFRDLKEQYDDAKVTAAEAKVTWLLRRRDAGESGLEVEIANAQKIFDSAVPQGPPAGLFLRSWC